MSGEPRTVADPPRQIAGPAAWRGAEMRNREVWIYRLNDGDIAELEQALAAAQRRGLAPAALEPADFPLPTLGPVLRTIRDELIDGRGFVLIRGLPVERYSRAEVAIPYLGLGGHIGRPVSQNADGHLLGHVRDRGYDPSDPAVRTYLTTERQHYHTDSVDIVGLLCLQPAKTGGLSSIVSSVTVYNEMMRRRAELAQQLFRPFATDRRGEVPAGQRPYFAIPVFNWYRGALTVIYNRRYIESAQRFADVPRLSAAEAAAFDLFDTLTEDAALHLDMALRAGDIQFLHNHTILHDRTRFTDWPEPTRKRHLLRLWLCPPNGRPLPAVFAERYGTVTPGQRGGIVVPGTRSTVPLD